MSEQRIKAAALLVGEEIVSLPAPARHHDIVHLLYKTRRPGVSVIAPENQGFITDDDRFVGRHEALEIAKKANQITRLTSPHMGLFSEDLW